MIKVDTRDADKNLKQLRKKLSPAQIKAATRMALNDSIRKAKTEVKKTILELYNIKSSRIDDRDKKKGLSVKLSQGNNMSAEVDAGHIPVNLVNISGNKFKRIEVGRKLAFASSLKSRKVKALRGGKIYRNQLTVEVAKGQRKTIYSAFIINQFKHAGSGQTVNINSGAVFARGKRGAPQFEFGKDRMPIDSISSLSVSTAARNTNAQERVQPKVTEYYQQQVTRQLQRKVNDIKAINP